MRSLRWLSGHAWSDCLPRVRWSIQAAFAALGWYVWAAIALGIACATFALFALSPLLLHVRQIHAQVASVPVKAPVKLPATADDLDAFERFLPPVDDLPALLRALYDAAERQHLTLAQADYRYQHGRDSLILGYRIALPVKGGYLAIRRFLGAALDAVPSLALESIHFSRQRPDDVNVEAQVELLLYLRAR